MSDNKASVLARKQARIRELKAAVAQREFDIAFYKGMLEANYIAAAERRCEYEQTVGEFIQLVKCALSPIKETSTVQRPRFDKTRR